MPRLTVLSVCLLALGLTFGVACGGDDDDDDDPATTPATTADDTGDQAQDVRGETSVAIEAENFAFSPALLRGDPGQALTLELTNNSGTPHNVSIDSESVDVDVADGETVEVEVKFPDSGSLTFVCKFHAGRDMEGQLLAGDAAPQLSAGGTPPAGDYEY